MKLDEIEKTFIINMKNNTERLDNSLKILSDYDIPTPERFDAIVGNDIPESEIKSMLSLRALSKLGSLPRTDHDQLGSKGAIGCYLSHVGVWKKIIEQQLKYTLIFEDDLAINNDKIHFYKNFENILNDVDDDFDMINLGAFDLNKNNFKLNGNVLINDHDKKSKFFSTHCYILSLNGAKKLLEECMPIEVQVDFYISYYMNKHPDFKIYFALKQLVSQKKNHSTIQTTCQNCNNEDTMTSKYMSLLLIVLLIGVGYLIYKYKLCNLETCVSPKNKKYILIALSIFIFILCIWIFKNKIIEGFI